MAASDFVGVIAPSLEPPSQYYYSIESACFKDWLSSAVKMQARRKEEHEQSNTSYFRYTEEERGFLLQRIFFSVYGPMAEGLSQYTVKQTNEANELKRAIVAAAAEKDGSVSMNVVFLSTFQNLAGPFAELDIVATEVPVFVVLKRGGERVFVSTRCDCFAQLDELLAEVGEDFKGGILYPAGLSYGESRRELVQLHYTESSGSSVANRGLEVIRDLVDVASMLFGVCSLVVCMPLPSYLRWVDGLAARVRTTALSCLSAAAALNAADASAALSKIAAWGPTDKSADCAIKLFTTALFALHNRKAAEFSRIADQIISNPEISQDLKAVESLFTGGPSMKLLLGLQTATACATIKIIFDSVHQLSTKKDWKRADLDVVAVSLFSLYNIVISPHSIEGFLKSAQMRLISEAAKGLKTEAAREAADSLSDFGDLLTGVMIVRNVLQLREPDHFRQSAADITDEADERKGGGGNDSDDGLGFDDNEEK